MNTNQEKISVSGKRAVSHFKSGFMCAESIFLAVAQHYYIESDLIPRLATGFCSGLAKTRTLCGAVSGGIMSINLITGRDSSDENPELNYQLIQKYLEQFKAKFGAVDCIDLLGCNLNDEVCAKKFKEEKMIEQCYQYVEEGTKIVLTLLAEK